MFRDMRNPQRTVSHQYLLLVSTSSWLLVNFPMGTTFSGHSDESEKLRLAPNLFNFSCQYLVKTIINKIPSSVIRPASNMDLNLVLKSPGSNLENEPISQTISVYLRKKSGFLLRFMNWTFLLAESITLGAADCISKCIYTALVPREEVGTSLSFITTLASDLGMTWLPPKARAVSLITLTKVRYKFHMIFSN